MNNDSRPPRGKRPFSSRSGGGDGYDGNSDQPRSPRPPRAYSGDRPSYRDGGRDGGNDRPQGGGYRGGPRPPRDGEGGDRPYGARPQGPRPHGPRPDGQRSEAYRPGGHRPGGHRPGGSGPGGPRPWQQEGGSGGDGERRFSGPRPPRPEGAGPRPRFNRDERPARTEGGEDRPNFRPREPREGGGGFQRADQFNSGGYERRDRPSFERGPRQDRPPREGGYSQGPRDGNGGYDRPRPARFNKDFGDRPARAPRDQFGDVDGNRIGVDSHEHRPAAPRKSFDRPYDPARKSFDRSGDRPFNKPFAKRFGPRPDQGGDAGGNTERRYDRPADGEGQPRFKRDFNRDGGRDGDREGGTPREGGPRESGPRESGFREGGYREGGPRQHGPRDGGGFREGGPRHKGGFNKGGFNKGGFNKGGFNKGGPRDGGASTVGVGPRLSAARAVAAVATGRSLDEAFTHFTAGLTEQDRSLAKAIAYGVVRERRLLDSVLEKLIDRPLRDEPELEALLLCGVYQLRSMRVSHHAAVAETVAGVDALGKFWAKGLVNAILRRYQREQRDIDAELPEDVVVQESYPDWLYAAIQQDWPEQADAIISAGNVQGPLTLRVNARRGTTEAYAQRLIEAGMPCKVVEPADALLCALQLNEAVGVERLPGFAEGDASVQDASAQLAIALLDAHPGQRVLDACAAPGGKSAHLLESVDGLKLLAIDSEPARLEKVRETLERLQLNSHAEQVELLSADAGMPGQWWDRQAYDRILLDAPCSGTGVIRRHPDIKWLRREEDISKLVNQQRRLLNGLWPLLAPGGVLVYATCSILNAEGTDVIANFLDTHPDAEEWTIDATWGEACQHGRRIAPAGDFDGFYYARLKKKAV